MSVLEDNIRSPLYKFLIFFIRNHLRRKIGGLTRISSVGVNDVVLLTDQTCHHRPSFGF